ncbi:hypothetical protein EBO34_00850 [Alteribacter keqinensis]|uniref:SpoVR-like C-terminal domain-containing protein n=1 Tax=Alteribacter keqinensis TaxID=2483800 RepID=A0A3M7TSY2_9BACI|nr:hypothetical protein EBO34_00850 [Alteribacter keqinensis]
MGSSEESAYLKPRERGIPYLQVTEGDYLKNGELYIAHAYENIELDTKYLEKTLPYLHQLWLRPVYMETVLSDRKIVFTYDGKKIHKRYL